MATDAQMLGRRFRRLRRRTLWILTALVAAALVAVTTQRAFDAGGTRADRPELQRVLDGLVRGSDRIAPGATAYVLGPNGTWLGSAGVADLRSGERSSAGFPGSSRTATGSRSASS